MRVHLGCDHAGFELKTVLTSLLVEWGHLPIDHGAHTVDATDNYPPFVLRAAEATAAQAGSIGVVIGGSGNGEAIAANKVHGVRAALAWNVETARLARLHNDANIVSIGARMHSLAEALLIVETFLGADFSRDERHVRRLAMVARYEDDGGLPPISGA
jgi:ribose 5-phosphate isomerase B